jgi:ABC-type nitrate/sulfonate/bicarbonate transport system substrate-binding protein
MRVFQLLLAESFAVLVAIAPPAWAKDELRLGWQVPWATQGQIVMGLKKTNIQEIVGQHITLVPFSYGPPLTSAALTGQVDILLTSDQPAIILLARAPSFRIVARMMYNRACLYVPRQSRINSISELNGTTVMGPVGAAAERVALALLGRSGVDLKRLNLGLLDMGQQASLMRRSGSDREWPGIDAMYGFDPFAAAFEETKRVRILDCGKIIAVVVASSDMVNRRQPELEKFLKAFILSWFYYASHPEQVNSWFIKESRLDASNAALELSASVEPNRFARNLESLRLDFTDEDRARLRETAQFLHARGTVKKFVDPGQFIDLTALRAISLADLTGLALQVRPRD